MFDLSKFSVPKDFRGKSPIVVQIWWFVHFFFFKMSPQIFNRWRVFLLRLFGARIGSNVIIRPSAKITYPWKLTIGENSWIGDDAVLYSLGEILIGENTIISQRCYICTGSHDYDSLDFRITAAPIIIGNSTWLATDVFVAPGVKIGDNCVIGARSSVFKDIESNSICLGSPAIKIRDKIQN